VAISWYFLGVKGKMKRTVRKAYGKKGSLEIFRFGTMKKTFPMPKAGKKRTKAGLCTIWGTLKRMPTKNQGREIGITCLINHPIQ